MFGGPIALYAVIGFGCRRARGRGLFRLRPQGARLLQRSGARASTALGGAGFLALTGSLLIVGFDAMCLSIGWCAGLVFMGVLFAPFVRKFGAYTVPTFLGRRFESRIVRVVAAAYSRCPILLLLAAEARFAGLCRGLDARPIGAPDGGRGGGLRRRHRAPRRHALAHLVERRQGHRRAAGAGGAGQHRRSDGLQPAAAADDARQRRCAC